jgi:hypothetical protein
MKKIVCLALALSLGGCASPYNPLNVDRVSRDNDNAYWGQMSQQLGPLLRDSGQKKVKHKN